MVLRHRYAEPCRIVRFSRSINDVFSVEESSDCCSLSSNRLSVPITVLRSTFHNAIVPPCLDDLAIDAGWPKHLPDDAFIELESVRGDQRNIFPVCSFR